jgi:hypothetical protein
MPSLVKLIPMLLSNWARKWGVSEDALADLHNQVNYHSIDAPIHSALSVSEASIQARVRLEASQLGIRLWRNNVGAVYTVDGSFLRYGLANESKAQNSILKSADLIGIRRVLIAPSDVGKTIGQFVSREIKCSSWKFSKKDEAQLNWANLINSYGGDAKFATGEGTL